jgi:hypothetical protein
MDLAPAADSAVFARALRGEPVRLEEFACFGHPVLAPAAGVVVTAVDTVPDHPAGTLPPFVGWGNHVVLDHGTGEFSMFDHLKQGSVPCARARGWRRGPWWAPAGTAGASPTRRCTTTC